MSHTVSVTLTDDEYEEALQKSREIGLDISQYVKRYNIGGEHLDHHANHFNRIVTRHRMSFNCERYAP